MGPPNPLTFIISGITLTIWAEIVLCEWCLESGPQCHMDHAHLRCRQQLTTHHLNYSDDALKELQICQIKGPTFEPDLLLNFPRLLSFSLVHSDILQISDCFPEHQFLQKLNLSNLKLSYLQDGMFDNLTALQILDLSYNNFPHLSVHIFPIGLTHIFLSGSSWNCSSDLRWISDTKIVADSQNMLCGPPIYMDKPVVGIMNFVTNMERECPKMEEKQCDCKVNNVVWSPDREYLVPVTTVNCSNLRLDKLPLSLPSNTTSLLLKNNNISDLMPIIFDRSYHRVADIDLENNLVGSEDIEKLEGANWLKKFRILNVRGNKIEVLPTYAFDNAFEENNHVAKVFFGNNPWKCECAFSLVFKDLLIKHQNLIQDLDDIKCANIESDDNTMVQVSELSRDVVCYDTEGFWLSYMDLLNLFLASLILFIFAKFVYDYWVYKTTGKLPWVAMRLL